MHPRFITLLSSLLLVAGLLLDVLTPASLVVSILLNVPIALSGLALSRVLTQRMMLFALAANVLSGVLNGPAQGGWDTTALVNRAFTALSYLLVGVLTLQLREASARVAALRIADARAREERALRALVEGVSGPHTPGELLARAARGLRGLIGADAVAVGVVQGNVFAPGAAVEPPAFPGVQAGVPLPGAWLASPTQPGEALVVDARGTLAVRWRQRAGQDVLAVAFGPSGSARLFAEGAALVAPQLDTAALLAQVRAEREGAERRGAVIRDLVYAFSHDLRTPILANLMSARLALAGAYGPLGDTYRAALGSSVQANEDLLALAERLLLVAKLEGGEFHLQHRPLDLAALAVDRADAMRAALTAHGAHLDVHAPGPLPVHGDATELRRVVQNLIENAGKWTPPGGTVTVRTDAQGGEAVLQVLDDGPGVPGEVRARLFQRFRGAGAGAGSGLGLYLARGIVEAHGGTVRYHRGDRTCFEVRVPLRPPAQGDPA
ncbi:sensor histidine kinase [Deinococcus maricopensis]|uniref:histidine kinase n=1 Tax=Deinococcus maricopensis (strain DSM 21211 / LMG 22137 / NRRL B-23946 / LB-34) TaxID=709986 RepID=E8U850_DEIML|nr:HAMP domain-containing sensor histidine kinase [Deinococcus maricopensis]ADV67239.1 integral membrane sensor signal transduction histidine kinase [Deinococcus maricopensis DSM 21211]